MGKQGLRFPSSGLGTALPPGGLLGLPVAAPLTTGDGPWPRLFHAQPGQDLSPGWSSGSPVPCRWVEEFLNEENRGLDVLLEYLAFAQCSVT